MDRENSFRGLSVRLVELSVDKPWAVLCIWGLLLGMIAPGFGMLTIDTSTGSVLDRSDESWAFYERSQEMFGGDEIVVVALESELPFSAQTLDFGRDLASRLEEIGGVARVDSLSTLPVIEVRGGEDLPAAGAGAGGTTGDILRASGTRRRIR